MIEVVRKLASLDNAAVIYIDNVKAASPDSAVALFDARALRKDGMHYFLEVEVAKDCVKAWSVRRNGKKPTLKDKCEAVIYYARNDAFLPPPDALPYEGPPLQLVDPTGGRTQGPARIRVPSRATPKAGRKRQ